MITIIDYGLGNVRSIFAKLHQMGEEVQISNDSTDIEDSDKFILPGVGAFDTGMKNLTELGLSELLHKKIIREKSPILGICLGMQLITQKSEEGVRNGLGYIPAKAIKFHFNLDPNFPVPHIGWNTIAIKNVDSPLLKGIPEASRFYFVHSYYVKCEDEADITANTCYGITFTSIIQHENIHGVQFHPEKSHHQGLTLLKNFARY